MTQVFYIPGKPSILDVALTGADGVLRGGYSRKTFAEIQADHPDAIVDDLGKVSEQIESLFVTAPIEIDQAQFYEMMGALPPKHWRNHGISESFQMIEHTSGNITAIFCRIENRYFEMQNQAGMSHEDIMRCIAVSFPDTLQRVTA
jgi:hypothetical protein